MSEFLSIETDARGVCTLTLNQPKRHNALSVGLMDALTQAAADLGADPAVRVVVLAAAGESFCAGGDLRWMAEQFAAGPSAR
ncbi:enoyl-CoA hydratase-related protein, partial [Actibacterium sp.]|uniref:enoyl-CoA hydratase-related protein n=1 Tax=Actibacterium sp. TaxID=1872125 RepID=UPI0035693F1C